MEELYNRIPEYIGDHYKENKEYDKKQEKQKELILPKGKNALEIAYTEYADTDWIVPNMIPAQGLIQLGAKKKMGKTFFCYELAAAVATGGRFLNYPVKKGKVLFFDLESSEKLSNERLWNYFTRDNANGLVNIEFFYDDVLKLSDSENSFIDQLEELLKVYPDTTLIIVDTVKKIRTSAGMKNERLHDDEEITKLHRFVHNHNIALLFTNHLIKGFTADPFDQLEGSGSIAGATDVNIVIRKCFNKFNKYERTEMHIENRFGESGAYNAEFKFPHWIVNNSLDEQEEVDYKAHFENNVTLKAIIALVNSGNGKWKGSSTDIKRKTAEIQHIPVEAIERSPQSYTKEVEELKEYLSEYYGIQYFANKSKQNSIQHQFTKVGLTEL